MSKVLRTALIGGGKVGHTHAQALQSLPGSQLVGVCGRTLERTAAFAQSYGARPHVNLRQMLIESQVQLLSICTPHPAHVETLVIAAEQGVHVVVEKPLAPDLQGCDRAIAACRGLVGYHQPATPVCTCSEDASCNRCRQNRPVDPCQPGCHGLAQPGILRDGCLAGQMGQRGRRGVSQPDRPPTRYLPMADRPHCGGLWLLG